MRPGDVMQPLSPSGYPGRFQCRGCDRWLTTSEAIDAGECSEGCCDDYKCPHCGHITRIEWPD